MILADSSTPGMTRARVRAGAHQVQCADVLRNVVRAEVGALGERRLDRERRAEKARQVVLKVERCEAVLELDCLLETSQAEIVLEKVHDPIAERLRLSVPVDAVAEMRHRHQHVQALATGRRHASGPFWSGACRYRLMSGGRPRPSKMSPISPR